MFATTPGRTDIPAATIEPQMPVRGFTGDAHLAEKALNQQLPGKWHSPDSHPGFLTACPPTRRCWVKAGFGC
jgi:hypothetical protein